MKRYRIPALLLCILMLTACTAHVPPATDPTPETPPQEQQQAQSDAPTAADDGAQSTPDAPPPAEPEIQTPAEGDTPVENDEESTDPAPQNVRNDAYFDNALFIGDSIMEGIRQYVAMARKTEPTLSDAAFLASTQGISLADLVGDRQTGVAYHYKGEAMPLTDIVTAIAPNRVFLLIGLNDMAAKEADTTVAMDRYGRLIDLLQATLPNAEIIVMTNPPKVAGSWLPDYTPNRQFGNALIDEYVAALQALCTQRNIPCVDTHAALSDDSGVLPEAYCRDGFVHLSNDGAAVVVEALYAFAANR